MPVAGGRGSDETLVMNRPLSLSLVVIIALSLGCTRAEPLNLDDLPLRTVEVWPHTFNVRTAGPEDGELVLLLHGFPQTSAEWRHQMRALADAGYFAVAPDQRGYSRGARPEAIDQYQARLLVRDAIAIADAFGGERFHLAGHDWGAAIAWGVAAAVPERVLSASIFSVPHPDAFKAQLQDRDSCQYGSSWYFDYFSDDYTERDLLAFDAAPLRLLYDGVEPAAVETYVQHFSHEPTLRAALHWYRANVKDRVLSHQEPIGPIAVPTVFFWSDGDSAICRETVDGNAALMTGEYELVVIEGIGHWIPELAAEQVSTKLLDHLGAHPAG